MSFSLFQQNVIDVGLYTFRNENIFFKKNYVELDSFQLQTFILMIKAETMRPNGSVERAVDFTNLDVSWILFRYQIRDVSSVLKKVHM